ncbi:MAG: hypothetical protein IKW83_07035 [Muribaculaceae bacterium]|nr:hypothetical protein [Muribaculaceae bacterium]
MLALLVIMALNSCDSSVLDTDKYHRNAKDAVEALFQELTNGDIKLLKEAVKFKESDKFTDQQKNEFFKQLKAKDFKVKAKKVKVKDGFTEVVCDFTYSDGTTKEKKFKLYKEDDIWKTEIGFSEMKEVINM